MFPVLPDVYKICNPTCVRGNFGLFCSFSPKLPRTAVAWITLLCKLDKTNREKGYYNLKLIPYVGFCNKHWEQFRRFIIVAVHLRTVKLFDVEQVYLCESAIFCISKELIFAIVEELSALLFLLGTKKVAKVASKLKLLHFLNQIN